MPKVLKRQVTRLAAIGALNGVKAKMEEAGKGGRGGASKRVDSRVRRIRSSMRGEEDDWDCGSSSDGSSGPGEGRTESGASKGARKEKKERKRKERKEGQPPLYRSLKFTVKGVEYKVGDTVEFEGKPRKGGKGEGKGKGGKVKMYGRVTKIWRDAELGKKVAKRVAASTGSKRVMAAPGVVGANKLSVYLLYRPADVVPLSGLSLDFVGDGEKVLIASQTTKSVPIINVAQSIRKISVAVHTADNAHQADYVVTKFFAHSTGSLRPAELAVLPVAQALGIDAVLPSSSSISSHPDPLPSALPPPLSPLSSSAPPTNLRQPAPPKQKRKRKRADQDPKPRARSLLVDPAPVPAPASVPAPAKRQKSLEHDDPTLQARMGKGGVGGDENVEECALM